MDSKSFISNCKTYCKNLSLAEAIRNGFYRLGYTIAKNPINTILITLTISVLLSLGNLNFHIEKNPFKLWIPKNSKLIKDTDWLLNNFAESHREQTVLVTAENVLDPSVLTKLAIINDAVTSITIDHNGMNVGWKDVCFKMPIIRDIIENMDDSDDYDYFVEYLDEDESMTAVPSTSSLSTIKPTEVKVASNPAVDWDPALFCQAVEHLPLGCRQEGLIELWRYNREEIKGLEFDDVVDAINITKKSRVTGFNLDVVPLLSGIKRDKNGEIIGASSVLSHWYLHVNMSEVDHDVTGNAAGVESWVSEKALKWEAKFIEVLQKLQEDLQKDGKIKIYFSAERSYPDSLDNNVAVAMDKFLISGILMFIYMQIVLSKFTWVEFRFILVSCGLFCIGLSIAVTCGICSLLGISYGPAHITFPFLLMGLGVDDVFVMMACWRKLCEANTDQEIPEKIGLMLKNAAVSITVTSLTDMVAFIVGISTLIPSFSSYCFYSAVSVFVIYLLVITLFVAVFALDERRIAARRNSIIPCFSHAGIKLKKLEEHNLMQGFLKFLYSKVLLTIPGKVFIILLAVIGSGFGFINIFKLEAQIDKNYILSKFSYQYAFREKKAELYPLSGHEGFILFGDIDYFASFDQINNFTKYVRNRTDVISNIDSWAENFNDFVKLYHPIDLVNKTQKISNIPNEKLRMYFTQFLYSQEGGRFQKSFKFKSPLKCGQPVPKMLAGAMKFDFQPYTDKRIITSKHEVQRIIDDFNLPIDKKNNFSVTSWGKRYANHEFDEILVSEISKNIILALVCVMICTGFLIADTQMCFWILVSVILTIANVGGVMKLLGLSCDFMLCICLLIAVGLCIDYAAHIGHHFLMMTEGTRNERALNTIMHIGEAIIYGAGSTIVAMCLLPFSNVVSLVVFFQEMTLVISFGVFYGMVFLPVILSLVGPKPHRTPQVMVDTKL